MVQGSAPVAGPYSIAKGVGPCAAAGRAVGEVGSLASVLNDLVHRTFFENPALDA
jgi:hypothetical protein